LTKPSAARVCTCKVTKKIRIANKKEEKFSKLFGFHTQKPMPTKTGVLWKEEKAPYPSSTQCLPKVVAAFVAWLQLGYTLGTPWLQLGYNLGTTWVEYVKSAEKV